MDVPFIFCLFCNNFLSRNGVCLGRKYVIDDDSPKGERSGLESKRPFCRFFFVLRMDEVKDFPRCFTVPYSYCIRNRIIASVLCVVRLVPKI